MDFLKAGIGGRFYLTDLSLACVGLPLAGMDFRLAESELVD